jgi:arylsulfatase A-like enzyme
MHDYTPRTYLFSALLPALLLLSACDKQAANTTTSNNDKPYAGTIENSIRNSTPDFKMDAKAPEQAPNIVVILVDDLGFADTSPYGSEIDTPNLEKLAANGLRYNNFTVTAMCSPTRAALLTGLNHHSAGVGWVAEWDFGYPGYRGELQANAVTLPQILQQNGYATYAAGKWHLTTGEHRSAAGPFNSWPTQKGFDRYWGFMEGETDQFEPAYIVSGNEIVDMPKDPDYYFPDDLTNHAIGMIKDLRAVNREKPFFLYYTPGAVHAPHHTKPEDRQKYLGKYAQGWDAIRQQRLEKQKQLGITPANTQLTAHNPGVENWDSLTADQKKMYTRFEENYAGFVDNLDQQVGKLMDYLEESHQLDNTIVIFLSDNGASPEGDAEGQANSLSYYHYHKTTTAENLQHFDGLGGPTSHPHYPWGWVQASNTPFKHTKRTTHGGGVRTPFIISWPKGITAKGELRSQFHHITDLAPTLLDIINAKAPETYAGNAVKPMEGISFAYTLNDASAPPQKNQQYYEIEANRAYVKDNWKIAAYRSVSMKDSQKFDETVWELFNLTEDFSEAHNLADQYPEKVKELEALWWEDAKKYDVLPLVDTGLLERALYSKFVKLPQPEHIRIPTDGQSIPHNLAPILPGKSWTLSAQITLDHIQQGGVIVAQGDQFSGYSIYVKNNKLFYERNVGFDVVLLESTKTLPIGTSNIEVRYEKVSTGLAVAKGLFSEGIDFNRLSVLEGTASLWIDGEQSGEAHIQQPFMIAWEGLDVGRDSRSSVSPHYEAPFNFSGKLTHVTYDLK